jgi:hypothetical protein
MRLSIDENDGMQQSMDPLVDCRALVAKARLHAMELRDECERTRARISKSRELIAAISNQLTSARRM